VGGGAAGAGGGGEGLGVGGVVAGGQDDELLQRPRVVEGVAAGGGAAVGQDDGQPERRAGAGQLMGRHPQGQAEIGGAEAAEAAEVDQDRKSTCLNSTH